MDTEGPLVDANEVTMHISMTLEEVARFLTNEDRDVLDVADFADNVRILAALVEMLSYTTVKDEFFTRMKTV